MKSADDLLKQIHDALERIGRNGIKDLHVQTKIVLEMQCDNLRVTIAESKVEPDWSRYPAAAGFFNLYTRYYR
jgi:hypothetical protein